MDKEKLKTLLAHIEQVANELPCAEGRGLLMPGKPAFMPPAGPPVSNPLSDIRASFP
jgi:hypothetical protein